jgi:hypothetical protein
MAVDGSGGARDPIQVPGMLVWNDPFTFRDTGLAPGSELPDVDAWLDRGPRGLHMQRHDVGGVGTLTYELVDGVPEVQFGQQAPIASHLRAAFDFTAAHDRNRFSAYSVCAFSNELNTGLTFSPTNFSGAFGNGFWKTRSGLKIAHGAIMLNGQVMDGQPFRWALNQFKVLSCVCRPGLAEVFVNGQRVAWSHNTPSLASTWFSATEYIGHEAKFQRQRDALYFFGDHPGGLRRGIETFLGNKYGIRIGSGEAPVQGDF